MPKIHTSFLRFLFGATAIGFLLSPCGQSIASEQGGKAPPPVVGVLQLRAQALPVVNELPGRIAATQISEVRARVTGILQERVFEQGAIVRQGDVLYRIDPHLFEVRVASAEASLKRANATRANAQQQAERQRSLREKNVGTGIEFDASVVNLAQADADVALAEASLAEAKINLDYTVVRAPISGKIGGALATEGALVTADGANSLALIQKLDTVYVDFTQSAQDLLNLKRAARAGQLDETSDGTRVELVFDDGSVYSERGRLLFSNADVDPSTGQVTLRAEFPNTGNDLLPGMYVRVRIMQALRRHALAIPQRAVSRDASGHAQVYIVDGGIAKARDVKLGEAIGTDWVVQTGLANGDTIVVDGQQKIGSGDEITAQAWSRPQQMEQVAGTKIVKTSEQ